MLLLKKIKEALNPAKALEIAFAQESEIKQQSYI